MRKRALLNTAGIHEIGTTFWEDDFPKVLTMCIPLEVQIKATIISPHSC